MFSAVSIQVNKIHICGGSILNIRWIITIAECVRDRDFEMVMGIQNQQDEKNAFRHKPLEVIIHCNYDQSQATNGIALVRTTNSIKHSWNIRHSNLAVEVPPVGAKIRFTGWGGESKNETFSNKLKILNAKSVSHTNCQGRIDPHNVCAHFPKDMGPCNADIGSGLFHFEDLVAVAGPKLSCGENRSDEFASIPYYYDFIRTTISTCDKF
ncbi:chymotrypsin-2-like [Drosophila novamexicana]|uniref:chymotrypsin-2-like n=1 Tax=Drosophila novamexicana TaxID=47314 RepID=UPI0011E5F3F9|nr:chymotrypsin-2-like [Drosophila novamexicana]